MQLQLQNFQTVVANAAAAVQGACSQLVDLTVGSTLRAVLEANASLALWLQWLILQVLRTTRAATSVGTDLDTWMADFTVTRLPAVAAYGEATFSRFTSTVAAIVPNGTTVRTADGTQSFEVFEDTTNPAWSAPQNGYVLAAGAASVTIPIVALVAGSAGNVVATAISLIAVALPGVDTVGNPYALQGGLDPETDAALRARFANFLASRSRATVVAIEYAIANVQQGLQYVLQENTAPDGTARQGFFTVTLDDGSGHPPAALISSVSAAIDAVRPTGSAFAVLPPAIVGAAVALAITTPPAANHATSVANVTAALAAYVNSLPVGVPLALTRLAGIAYAADPNVTNVTAITIDAGTADLAAGNTAVIKATSVTVT